MQPVKEIREALGMTQAEFARDVGVDTITVSRWERGVSSPRGVLLNRKLAEMDTKAIRKAAKAKSTTAGS